jgi:hypothetical protein
MIRTLAYTLAGAALLLASLAWAAHANGIDPRSPDVRMIVILSVAATLYFSLRVTTSLRGLLAGRARRKGESELEPDKKRGLFHRWGRSDALDARFEARRERLRQARAAGKLDDPGDE